MQEKRGNSGYIRGPSVHNQRIERLHCDTTQCVLSYYIHLFKFMESNNTLCSSDEIDLFALHFVYLSRIQKSLDEFKDAWNHHVMSTEKNKMPHQIWTVGMIDCNNENQRTVTDFLSDAHLESFGVSLEEVVQNGDDEDYSEVKLRRIDIGEKQEEIANNLKSHFITFWMTMEIMK